MSYARCAFAGLTTLPEPPAAGLHVWGWYADLRGATAGTDPVTYQEIAAYAELTGARPRPIEVEWLRALDTAWLEHVAKRSKGGPRQIPIDDVAGIDALLGRQAMRYG